MHRVIVVIEALAVMRDATRAQPLLQDRQHLFVRLPHRRQFAAEQLMLRVAHAAPDPRHEPAMRKLVDHAELLDQPRRMIQRQAQHHRAQPYLRCAPRHRREEHDRRRRHVQRGEVVLGDMIAVEPELLGVPDQLDAFIVLLPQRHVGALLEVIPPAELQCHRRS